MVGKAYMLDQPPRPSGTKQWLDRQAVPALLNAVAPIEGALYRASEHARRHPLVGLVAAFACGCVLHAVSRPRRAHPRQERRGGSG